MKWDWRNRASGNGSFAIGLCSSRKEPCSSKLVSRCLDFFPYLLDINTSMVMINCEHHIVQKKIFFDDTIFIMYKMILQMLTILNNIKFDQSVQ